ncbi:MAG: UDP-3-O-[3-hydroxymyristoyl] N-acetylglucosamine deacetylase [Sphingobacteriales bacterium]|jgi:UDP-3-O-[3-hydroxymyristoyl] N-acetylglucosamine deacetylase/3-hydroxyacyl-[acyl-carrier-protein] dehydratase
MSNKQKTLKAEFALSGIGLHTGERVNLKVLPAKENFGYKFQLIGVEGEPIIPADADLVTTTTRGTTIEKNGAAVHTTEHLLAALYAMGVDNALIQLEGGSEIPIMDGSSFAFVEAIKSVGIEEQNAEIDYFVLDENISFEDPVKGVEMLAVPTPGGEYRITVMVDYNSRVLGTQHASMYNLSEFEDNFARCRTFCFLKEVEFLAENGLIKGGDIENAVVLVERSDVTQEELNTLAKKLGKENMTLKVDSRGVLNNTPLHFDNEPARHKLLDIIGDLALVGKRIKGHILAARPGHAGNVDFARLLKQKIKEAKTKPRKFDLTKDPVYDINQIAEILPHRYPFLLVDKIMEISDNGIVGLKNVTLNEPYFTGHFPNNPVMPGVLQVEAMAQCGGVFALNQVDEPEKYSTYFMKIDAVKFKRKVIPGDTLVFDLKLISPIRRGIVHMKGVAYANGMVASEAEMVAQVIKDKE